MEEIGLPTLNGILFSLSTQVKSFGMQICETKATNPLLFVALPQHKHDVHITKATQGPLQLDPKGLEESYSNTL